MLSYIQLPSILLTCCHRKSCKFLSHFLHGPVIAAFSVQILKCLLQSFFRCTECVLIQTCKYRHANYISQGVFAIIFFYVQRSCQLPQKRIHHKNIKWLKLHQSPLHKDDLMYSLYGQPKMSSSSKNINNTASVYRLPFRFS